MQTNMPHRRLIMPASACRRGDARDWLPCAQTCSAALPRHARGKYRGSRRTRSLPPLLARGRDNLRVCCHRLKRCCRGDMQKSALNDRWTRRALLRLYRRDR